KPKLASSASVPLATPRQIIPIGCGPRPRPCAPLVEPESSALGNDHLTQTSTTADKYAQDNPDPKSKAQCSIRILVDKLVCRLNPGGSLLLQFSTGVLGDLQRRDQLFSRSQRPVIQVARSRLKQLFPIVNDYVQVLQ